MNTFAGTRTLTRLALRLDRVRLTVWVVLLGLTPAATAAQYKKLYPTAESLAAVKSVISNASLVALNGPMFRVSLGGLTAWKIGISEFIFVAVMSILTVVRHSRTEEETGRLDLVGSGAVGRYAPLSAALLTAGVANLGAFLLVVLGLAGTGLPASGALALGLVVAATGMLFAACAAVAAQLFESARTANAAALAVLGGVYLLRALGDTGPTWVSWCSPIGWAMRVRPYAGERWWLLVPALGLAAALALAAYRLVARRDVNAGLVPQRPGPAYGAPSLRSPFALAWRLQRGSLIGWTIGLAVSGVVLGGAAQAIAGVHAPSQQITDMLARMGGRKALVDEYLAAVFGIVGLVAAGYTVQATLRLRAEEAAGRMEPLLATRVSRVRFALSHLVFALLGTAVLLGAAGLGGGVAYGLAEHDAGQVPRILGAALVQLPAAWVLAGLGVTLFGLVPRLAAITWACLVACVLLLELGALLGLNHWVVDASPFAHVPKLPGTAFTQAPILWLTALAAALAAAGLAGFRRRDIG